MPHRLALVQRMAFPDLAKDQINSLALGDLLQRLAVLCPAKLEAIHVLTRVALLEEIAKTNALR